MLRKKPGSLAERVDAACSCVRSRALGWLCILDQVAQEDTLWLSAAQAEAATILGSALKSVGLFVAPCVARSANSVSYVVSGKL